MKRAVLSPEDRLDAVLLILKLSLYSHSNCFLWREGSVKKIG